MNQSRYQLITQIIKQFLQFMAFYTVMAALVFLATKNLSMTYGTLLLFPVPIICFLANRYIRKLYLYIPLHLLTIAACIIPVWHQHVAVPIIYSFYIAFTMITSFITGMQGIDEAKKNVSPALLLLPAVSLLLIYSQSLQRIAGLLYYVLFAGILLYLVNHYLLHLGSYFNSNRDVSGIPYKQIKASSHMLIGIFMSLCVFIMLISGFFPLKTILLKIRDFIFLLLRLFFSLFKPSSEVEEIVAETPITNAPQDDFFPLEESEPSIIMEIIEKILYGAAMIAIVAAIIALLLYLIYQFYKYFYGRNQDARDSAAFLSPFDKIEPLKALHKTYNGRTVTLPRIFGNHSAKIRTLFYHAVNTKHKEPIPDCLTSSELLVYEQETHSLITAASNKMPASDAALLSSLYEKARYSNLECTKEDVKCFKQLLKTYLDA